MVGTLTVEIPLRLKYRLGGRSKKGKIVGNGDSGVNSKGKVLPVGIRKNYRGKTRFK